MSKKFLFHCPNCQSPIELQVVQAGQDIGCQACGQSVMAPQLREIKKLPAVGADPEPTQPSPLKRTLVGIGLILTILMGSLGTALYYYASGMIVEVDWEQQYARWDEHVDQMTPAELLFTWNSLDVDSGLGPWQEQALSHYRIQGQILHKIAYGLWGLATLGILLLASSFFIRGPS